MSTNTKWHKHTITKEDRAKIKNQKSFVIWFTGLSGSGKSTIANELECKLWELNKHTYLLDGDNIRQGLNSDLGFSDKDRKENIRRVAQLAKLFTDSGLITIVAFISPFKKDREMVKALFSNKEFIEVFIDTPLEICINRDTKGLYKKALKGEIKNFTGVSSPYEKPANPDIHIKTNITNIEEATNQIINFLKKHLLLY